jgi:hypothetical protein
MEKYRVLISTNDVIAYKTPLALVLSNFHHTSILPAPVGRTWSSLPRRKPAKQLIHFVLAGLIRNTIHLVDA